MKYTFEVDYDNIKMRYKKEKTGHIIIWEYVFAIFVLDLVGLIAYRYIVLLYIILMYFFP